MTPVFQAQLRRFRIVALAIGALGLIACFIGAIFQAAEFFQGYLFGLLFWLGLALGCMTITMLHYLTGGRWGYPIRRFLEAGFSTLPLMLVLFVPVFIGLGDLYPWANQHVVASDIVLKKRAPYMNPPWFIGRTIFWLLAWIVMGRLLRHWSLEQDRTRAVEPTKRARVLSGPGLVALSLSVTFAYVDWIMSLEQDWYSQVFGIVVMAGQVLVAFAFMAILMRAFENQPDLSNVIGRVTSHQIGNLILAFVLFWSYLAFAQLLIIYSANLPHEISWYLHRIDGGWKIVVAAIAFFHFFFPFIMLLFRSLKENVSTLAALACTIVAIHIVEVYWFVAPSFYTHGFGVTWFYFAALIGIGGVWLGTFFALLARAPLMPANDPRMEAELAYGTG